MTRPTYKEFFLGTQPDGHAGLWYEKYCNTWEPDSHEPPPPSNPLVWSLKATGATSPKLDWVNTATGASYAKAQGKALLAEHHARMQALCQGRNALQLHFKTTSRLVIGIGQDHPIENGFLWHPTLGVPYIPGTSIKGMLRNWMLVWEGQTIATSWFESVAEKGVGELIFLDALPLEVPKLEADVITPHYGPYYRKPQKEPPADWHSPVPTPFLTVAQGATFVVRAIIRPGLRNATPDFDTLKTALTGAFDVLGIGAKTAVGYGRLDFVAGTKKTYTLPIKINALQEFKDLCRAFGDFSRHMGKQSTLVTGLVALNITDRVLAKAFLLGDLKIKRRNCTIALQAQLFID